MVAGNLVEAKHLFRLIRGELKALNVHFRASLPEAGTLDDQGFQHSSEGKPRCRRRDWNQGKALAQDFEPRGAAIGACREGGLGLGVPTRPDSRAELIF